MVESDLISILIPCYNGEKYLDRCLGALLKQTYTHIEVIIVDDGSTDGSARIIRGYVEKFRKRGEKLIYVYQDNCGQAAAINTALKYMSGDYIMWQDVDDFYEKDAVENLHNYLKDKMEYDFVRGEVANVELKDGKEVKAIARSKYPKKDNIFSLYLFEKDAYCFVGLFMIRTKYFDKCISKRNIYNSRAGQNWQIILPIAYKGKCGYFAKVVYNYTVHMDSHFHSVVDKKEKIKRCKSHEDILLHVIDSIKSMKIVVKCMYKIRIRIRYILKGLKILVLG